jgi:hemoglobin
MPLESSRTVANPAGPTTKKPTLADRMGGEGALKAAIAGLYGRILSDPDLAPFFDGVDMSSQERHQLRFFKVAFGHLPGSLDVPALILEKHARLFAMGLNEEHFDRVAGHLVASLQELGVAESLIDEAAAVIGPLRPVFEHGARRVRERAK